MVRSGSLDVVIPVYNGENALKKLLPDIKTWVNENSNVYVYIVDDGSEDKLDSILKDMSPSNRIHLILHGTNRGRAAACNSGFSAGIGEYIAFLDVDCKPNKNWVARFIESMSRGFDGVFGNIKASGSSFFADYSNSVYNFRVKNYRDDKMVLSTPFCAFRRDALELVGGFCTQYVRYGFEDRDLLCSLIAAGKSNFDFLEDVYVEHRTDDLVSLLERKMENAGYFSAAVFSKRFPSEYKRSQYWWFDSRLHGQVYNVLLSTLYIPCSLISSKSQKIMDNNLLPFLLKKLVMKYLMAMSFYRGSFRSKQKSTKC